MARRERLGVLGAVALAIVLGYVSSLVPGNAEAIMPPPPQVHGPTVSSWATTACPGGSFTCSLFCPAFAGSDEVLFVSTATSRLQDFTPEWNGVANSTSTGLLILGGVAPAIGEIQVWGILNVGGTGTATVYLPGNTSASVGCFDVQGAQKGLFSQVFSRTFTGSDTGSNSLYVVTNASAADDLSLAVVLTDSTNSAFWFFPTHAETSLSFSGGWTAFSVAKFSSSGGNPMQGDLVTSSPWASAGVVIA